MTRQTWVEGTRGGSLGYCRIEGGMSGFDQSIQVSCDVADRVRKLSRFAVADRRTKSTFLHDKGQDNEKQGFGAQSCSCFPSVSRLLVLQLP